MIRLWIGCLAFLTAPVAAHAQTYYYYPSYVTSAPTVAWGAAVAPTYYYVQPTYQYQVAATGYAPQYYQSVQATQYYQPVQAAQYYQVGYQTQAVQAAVNTPAAPTSDTKVVKASATQEVKASDSPAEEAPAAPAGDPYGFTGWLNATRAAYGLPAVGHDPNLSSWAAVNNNHQAAYGMGHYVMGSARRQNSAMGDFSNIGTMWMNSPAHRAALLDPTIRFIGIAGLGAYWTFNAN